MRCLLALVVVACGGTRASQNVTIAPVASASSNDGGSDFSAAEAVHARVGDVTCQTDADCTATTRKSCCDCCATGPYATSKKWITWFEGDCQTARCVACAVKCAPAEPLPRAVCQRNECVLAP